MIIVSSFNAELSLQYILCISQTLAIADYFKQTFEDLLILRHVLRPRRICDIYDFFAPFIKLLTYTCYFHLRRLHSVHKQLRHVWCQTD